MDGDRFRFLFRTDAGVIDREVWLKYASALAGVVVALTLGWLPLRGHIVHDLAQSKLFEPLIFAAYAYAMFLAFALMLIGVSYMNLTAKRFRARAWPSPLGLAGLCPLFAFLSGALRLAPILSPAGLDIVPAWALWGMEGAFAAATLWTLWELGLRR